MGVKVSTNRRRTVIPLGNEGNNAALSVRSKEACLEEEEEQKRIHEELSNGDVLCDIRRITNRPSQVSMRPRGSLTGTESNSVVTAVGRLRELITLLERDDELPDKKYMNSSLTYAIDILSTIANKNSPMNEIDADLQDLVPHDEVRAWLASTFTSRETLYSEVSRPKPTFKAVVGTIIVGQYFGKMAETHHLVYPPGVADLFHRQLDGWNCDIFKLEKLTDVHPLKHISYELFTRHELLREFKIPSATFEAFLTRVENGYQLHGNPYHNCTHAADVVQTVHSFIKLAKLEEWLSKLEILALLFSAIIHDLEHTGTTNSFHVHTRSELSLCYNDQSILENYHLNRAFTILKEMEVNIFRNLTTEQFTQVRTLTIEMVLATDMSKHFAQLKHMKRLLSSSDGWCQLQNSEKSSLLCLILHIADISHPGKEWAMHHQWTERIQEEFFRQGDKEQELGLLCSPLCDRATTVVPESQKGFIDFIIRPSFEVLGDLLAFTFDKRDIHNTEGFRVWDDHIKTNYNKWDKKCKEKDEKLTESTEKSEDKPTVLNGTLSST
ncbi:PREDICTED: calcium/calmodulin-dependent 3',5'-cyclic nucleotide phosphodiesterase 1B-like isoform X2 [Amphimedon queenslandica]|uniref:Phosphodiesterase n=1 Tax=Amphimedon queenslandica TaxID=400682 RepID=A0AAN0INP7_AMPQE|nr:PREDICTED: calcium/calmodulin-dependent 3',5'-cyclic nucleotide phosphodiesterase 1B-like isoform X2 [Amphimedon queenslandica]|eukprot:XP_011405148.2 PREDICTED: calcium/calmodulin-dependent 3',5'-cyclic nucleotide phosphodiesterase 1B-like isoform X2 [Amphimedon queenslandica]